MPDFKDLKDIKDKIDNIGDEKKIRDEKGLPSEDFSLPEEEITSSKEELEQTPPPVEEGAGSEEEDLLGDILEDFEKGHVMQDENIEDAEATIIEKDPEEAGSEDLKDLLTDTGMKDEGDIESVDKGIEGLLSSGIEEEVAEEEKIEGMDDFGLGFDEESELGDIEKMQEKSETEGEIGDFDNLLGEETGKEKEEASMVGEEELDALLKQPLDEEPVTGIEEEGMKADESAMGDEELDALLNQPFEEEKGMDVEEEPIMEEPEDIPYRDEESVSQVDEKTTGDEILEKLGEKETESKFDDLPDLESLLGEGEKETDISKEGLEGILGESAEGTEELPGEEFEMPDFTAEADKEPEGLGSILGEEAENHADESVEEFEMPDFTAEADKEPEGLEGVIGEEFQEHISEVPEGLDTVEKEEDFDFDMIGEIGTESIGEEPSFESKEEISDIAGFEVKDSSYGEIPEEISKEDLRVDHDIKIDLTEDERKQILISLTSLPKEVELKISKAIISNKYSNTQLKPLINALIDKESPHIIIKYYEKITGDKSLSAIEGVKYTGVKFEERKKTFSYIFEKNILPLLAKISVVIVVFVLLILFTLRVIIPTWQASNLYKEGRKLIDNKLYLEGEEKFKKAFDKQPRFGEVVKYARKYREHKRYLATEGKYELAVNMKPDNNNIVLEYSDFLREKKDFERAERMYQGMIKTDRNKLQATLGLAKTYYDWAEEETGKLEDA